MEKLILILFLVVSMPLFSAQAQVEMPTNKQGLAELSHVNESELKKDQLFFNAKDAIFSSFKSGKTVIQYEDKEEGRILGKAITKTFLYQNTLTKSPAGYYSYSFVVQVKDNKYKITVKDIKYVSNGLGRSGADLAVDYPANWPKKFTKKFYKRAWSLVRGKAVNYLDEAVLALSDEINKEVEEEW